KTYIAIGELLKNNTFPFRTALSANLACTRFLLSEVESLREKGEIKESENKFQKAKEQFENIIEEIPPEEYKREAIVRNVYGSYLYDILDKKDEGIAQLEKAHEVWPEHGYTIHKLATICIREGENLEGKERLDYWKKAEDYLKESLNIDPSHYPHYLTKRSLAELKGKSTDWNKLVKSVREGKLSESEFWNKASIIYNKYQDQEALEPETDYPSLHNSIVHNSAGWFLWNLEMSVKDFLQNKDSSIPSADIEFRKSIEIGGKFKDTEGNVIKEILPWKIRKHLAITYEALSSYLTMTGNSRNDQVMVKEGHFFSERYIELSKENGKIIYHSGNASNESYIGKLLLDQGEIDEAIKCFRRSINLCDNNSCALWWLKEIYEKEEGYQDYKKAIKYYGRYAKIQNSPSLYRAVRNTAKKWMKEGQIPYDVDLLIKYSKKGYEIDPNGDMNPKNVSDYAYDLLQKWKGTGNYVILEKAKKLFTYLIKWAIQSIDENPDKEDAYISLIRYYCVPIWKSGQLLNDDIVSEIEACAKRHREYPAARKMIGIVLHRNRKSEKALPYLEEFKDSEDTYVLRSLMEAYSWVEKVKEAEETYKRLYSLLDNEKLKSGLKRHASEMGLKCS
ncbi:MAG: hypothetical protein KAW56_13085, partial [Candidatus Marinimicrobia bacterium]|nr:hypothetical protein [Candidatus Neomarinimicrobiota bacterium]